MRKIRISVDSIVGCAGLKQREFTKIFRVSERFVLMASGRVVVV